jgi:hypothetical protein
VRAPASRLGLSYHDPHGFRVRAHGARIARRAPVTVRGAGAASMTVTRGS